MNDSTDIPQPRAASEHINAGDPQDSPQAVDNEEEGVRILPPASAAPTTRLLVIGTDRWRNPALIRDALVFWYNQQHKPTVHLVTDDTIVGQLAVAVWAKDRFPYEVHPIDDGLRRPERARRRRILDAGFSHAIVFVSGPDPYAQEWLTLLAERNIPVHLYRFDVVD